MGDDEEDETLTSSVTQQYSIATMDTQLVALYTLLRSLCGMPGAVTAPRLLVFFPTVRMTQFYQESFAIAGWPVLSVHSRMPQAVQERERECFIREGGVMFASDAMLGRDSMSTVCAAVVQMGLPSSVGQYRSRLMHCMASGTGHLLICAFEEPCCVRELSPRLQHNPGAHLPLDADFQERIHSMKAAMDHTPQISQVYQSWLGYYNSHLKRLEWTREELVRHATLFAVQGLGLPSAPTLNARQVGMMALKGVDGLVIAEPKGALPQSNGGRGARGSGGRGGNARRRGSAPSV